MDPLMCLNNISNELSSASLVASRRIIRIDGIHISLGDGPSFLDLISFLRFI